MAGGQSGLARICGVGQPAVWKWLQSGKRLPPVHVLKVEVATGVSRHLLRPDIYPVDQVIVPADEEPSLECGPVLSRRSTSHQCNGAPVLDNRRVA